jgi:DNA recombination protein RmuC
MDTVSLFVGLAAGAIIGGLAIYVRERAVLAAERRESLRLKTVLEQERRGAAEKEQSRKEQEERSRSEFEALSARALRDNNESFLTLARETLAKQQTEARGELEKREQAVGKLVEPLGKSLDKVTEEIGRIEKARAEAYGSLNEQIRALAGAQEKLQSETGNLVQALRRPSVRGQWGEMQLRRVVEMAGMLDHVDFVEQVSTDGEEGRLRPDMLVHLPGGTEVVVDAKTPLEAYLNSLDAEEEEGREACLVNHARQVRDHVRKLGAKAYQDQFSRSPEFTVMFLPSESIFYAALEKDPTLIEVGVDQKVLLATPTTLIALLRTVHYGWRQEALAENAEKISELGRELYERVCKLGDHFANLGKRIGNTVDAYNEAVGTLERRVLPQARRFPELGIRSGKAAPVLDAVEKSARELSAAELAPDEAPDEDDAPQGSSRG